MGKSQRDKGARIEREIVNVHMELGVYAERVPLSGAVSYKGEPADVDLYLFGKDNPPLITEVKGRKNDDGFKCINQWLGNNDLLFIRENGKDPHVYMPWRTWEPIIWRLK